MKDDSLQEFDTAKEAAQAAADVLTTTLIEQSGKDNLLLLSGGSSAEVVFWASSRFDMNTTNSVTVAQADERYGQPRHADSNWKLLLDKGLKPNIFRNAIEILELGTTPSDMSISYNRALIERMDNLDYKVAVLGIGEDGHIAGMLPADEEKFDRFLGEDLVVDFEAEDFTRITTTARTLLQMDLIILFACGDKKKQVIDDIYSLKALNRFPAQMLKQCKNVQIFFGKECN